MPTRNTGILSEIIQSMGALVSNPQEALARLEHAYRHKLLIVAGDTAAVARYAEELRLAINTPESETVLDYIGTEALAGININQVEDAINALFEDRFIEP